MPARILPHDRVRPRTAHHSLSSLSLWLFAAPRPRAHGACRYLVTVPSLKLVAGRLVERVLFDDTRYERFDAETRWSASQNADYDPEAPSLLNDYLYDVAASSDGWEHTQIGAEQIAALPTTHYQFWSTDTAATGEAGGQLVYDIWLSDDHHVIADSLSVRGTTIPELGEGTLSDLWVYTDHNAPITVGVPPAAQVTLAP